MQDLEMEKKRTNQTDYHYKTNSLKQKNSLAAYFIATPTILWYIMQNDLEGTPWLHA